MRLIRRKQSDDGSTRWRVPANVIAASADWMGERSLTLGSLAAGGPGGDHVDTRFLVLSGGYLRGPELRSRGFRSQKREVQNAPQAPHRYRDGRSRHAVR